MSVLKRVKYGHLGSRIGMAPPYQISDWYGGRPTCHTASGDTGTGKVRDFKFGVRIGRQARKQKTAKVGQKGRGIRHVTYFYNSGTPFISLEHTKLENSNLVCR